jgi:abortive infection bacteriophage resistance protein
LREGPGVKFLKPALSLFQQLQKWEARGLGVSNNASALHYLQHIGYYRLSAYALPFQQSSLPDKPFRAGSSFEDILNLYVFDRELRLLVIDAIERIEVAVRSSLTNHLCIKHGPHWFTDATQFKPHIFGSSGKVIGFDHTKLLDQIDKELGIAPSAKKPMRPHNEVFINHYFSKYTDPYLPPAWMVFELVSLGTLSLVFANLKDAKDRSAIALPFAVDEKVLITWLHSLSYLRNLCAHHGRLWNRQLVIKPLVAKKHTGFLKSNDRFYAMAVVLWDLLRVVAPQSIWNQRLAELLGQFPAVPSAAMGFPANWKDEPFWNLTPIEFNI